ncbi:MAG TPA: ATP-binding protein [Rhabdaerophilum sp.]|nr:ATP-binding protein [Rhabdaerophilum sp.]
MKLDRPDDHGAAAPKASAPFRKRLLQGIARHAAAIVAVSAVFAMWFVLISKRHDDRQTALEHAQQNSRLQSRSLEEHFRRTVEGLDQSLRYLRDIYAFDFGDFDLTRWRRDGRFLTEVALQVSMIDQNGMLLDTNLRHSTKVNLSDRAHFRFHIETSRDVLFISRPVFGRVSKKWSIQLTRRVTDLEGNFRGVMVASLDVENIARFYDSVRMGASGAIMIVGDDGMIRVHAPDAATYMTGKFQTTPESTIPDPAGDADQFFSTVGPDGVVRQYVSRRVPGTTMRVMVGQAQDDILHDVNSRWRDEVLFGTLMTLWIGLFAVLVIRYQRGLARARDAAEAGKRARSAFLATMTHEIRTPLNGVIGIADLLCATPLDARQVKLIDTLKTSAMHLMGLINGVLHFTRLEANPAHVDHQHFSLADLVGQVLDALRPAARERGIALDLEVDPAIRSAYFGDAGGIRQMLFNLAGNGIKFTEKGGVTVRIASIASGEPGLQRVAIDVEDTGVGIPEAARADLFEVFQQADATIARRYGGSGLGLAISRRIARQLGGDLVLAGSTGGGSCFRITLDLAPGDPERIAGPEMSQGGRLVKSRHFLSKRVLRILVAEDNSTNQLVISQLIRLLGHECTVVANGAEAIEAVAVGAFDLVLMDMMMPRVDGLAATREIRRGEGAGRHVLISALTANSLPENEETCRAAGMDAFLAKPVTRASIEGLLARLFPELCHASEPEPLSAEGTTIEAGEPDFERRIAELHRELGEAGAREVIAEFIGECSENLMSIHRAIVSGDRLELKLVAHSIKGSARGLGLGALAEAARQLEYVYQADLARLHEGERQINAAYEDARRKLANLR